MEGNERIVLYRPEDPVVDGTTGQPIPSEPTQVIAYALRQDRGGRETAYADQQAGNWLTRFRIRRLPGNEDLNENWYLADGRGLIYDIESRTEVMGRRTHWFIFAIRRTTRS